MSFAYVYCLQSSGTKHLNFLQDNLSRGNMGAVDMLRALFPKPGHLQFLYVDLGDSQAVSIFIMLHFLLKSPTKIHEGKNRVKRYCDLYVGECTDKVFALFLLTTVVGRERERDSHMEIMCALGFFHVEESLT
jgi:hypothetical protein